MTKKLINYLLYSLLIIIYIYIFIYSKEVKETVIYGINIWIYNLFPSIFPFLLMTKLIAYHNLFDYVNNLFGNIISNIFKVSKASTYIIILSLFCGFPTSAIYIKDLLISNKINVNEANRLLTFTSFANPIFIISFIGENLLNSKTIGIFIYIIHIITGLSISFIFKSNKILNNNILKNNNEKNCFSKILIKSINESFITLTNMLGIIVFFLLILSIINTFIANNLLILILKSFIELTTGVISISKSSLNIRLKASIIGGIISFNGLSIHYQIKSILNDSPINFRYFLKARIIHSILGFIIIFTFFNFI